MSAASGNLRVVVDTNVLVSAAIMPRRQPQGVLEAWEHGSFQMLMADEMLAEVTDVLQRDAIRQKYHLADEQIARLVHDLTVATERVLPHDPPPVSSRDPKDDEQRERRCGQHVDGRAVASSNLRPSRRGWRRRPRTAASSGPTCSTR